MLYASKYWENLPPLAPPIVFRVNAQEENEHTLPTDGYRNLTTSAERNVPRTHGSQRSYLDLEIL